MRISDWSSDVCSSDGIPIAEIALDDVTVTADSLLGGAGSGAGVLERVFEEANAALAAEAVGIMSERSEEHTSELQSLMRISYAVFCLKKKKTRVTRAERNCKNESYEVRIMRE